MFNISEYRSAKKIDNIEVKISYKIIELFSAGLYSSPNKAFEELICNSYDAGANKVSVYVSPDLAAEESFIWVCDNGSGLNAQELNNTLIGNTTGSAHDATFEITVTATAEGYAPTYFKVYAKITAHTSNI